ncbi:hypothetical protein [Actinoplanes sp. NPDC051859]|uniref:hypothetical protein n=1 Tax=Actinoplanes sp. NPDC051859 TaxID=3363909 RepID=UPI0037A6D99F
MRTARTIPLLVVCSLVVTLGACSSGPAPSAWAASVCKVLTPWRSEIGTLTTRTQQQMTAATTPAQAKENLMRLFGGAESASEKARAGVQDAGVPDVDEGKRVADGFTASLSAMRDAYGKAKTGIEGLATSPAKDFYARVGTVVDTLNTEYKASELDTSNLSSVELQKAFDAVPECR